MSRWITLRICLVLALFVVTGCCAGKRTAGTSPGAVGAATTSARQQRQQLDRLGADLRQGKITPQEYLQRKEQIEAGALMYRDDQ